MKTYLITLTLLSTFFFIGCKKDGPIEPPTSAENLQHSQSTSLSKNSYNYLQARNSAATLAKKLAHELNADENLRKEVFSKIAYKFDGDKDILFSHLNNSTLAKLQLHAEVRNAVTNVPKLQIMMPFMEKWTDNSITNYGGLIVAYYPFGVDDKEITQIVGYDKNGNEVIITKETAPTIPYIIISSNERTDDNGDLKTVGKNGQKFQSIHNVNPKDYEVTDDANWKNKELTKTKKNDLPITNLMPSAEDEDGGGGGGGGGGGTPAPTTHSWGMNNSLRVNSFKCTNVGTVEPYWFKGDPEFRIKMKWVRADAVPSNTTDPEFGVISAAEVYLDNVYNFTLSWGVPKYRSDWASMNWTPVSRSGVKEGENMFIAAVEDDGGNSIDITGSFTYTYNQGSATATSTVNVKLSFKDDDEIFGSVYFGTQRQLPTEIGLGTFSLKANDQ